MASVSKRGNKYTVRYSYENERGEKVPGWESFSSEQEATDRKHQIELEQKRGDFLAPNTMTVKELFDRWLPIQNTKHRWAPKTYLSNLGQVQDLICPYIGAMQVQKVRVNTYAHIQDRSRLELSHKFEEDFYRHSPNPDTDKADMDSSEVSCDLLLQAIRNATPEQKKQLTLALLA